MPWFLYSFYCLSVCRFSSVHFSTVWLGSRSVWICCWLVQSLICLCHVLYSFYIGAVCLSVRPSVVFSFLLNFVDVVVVVINVGGWMAASSVGRVYSRFFFSVNFKFENISYNNTNKNGIRCTLYAISRHTPIRNVWL